MEAFVVNIEKAQAEFAADRLREAVAQPADEGNGWMVLLETVDGAHVKLTDHGGHEKIYHTLDHATDAARTIGFDAVRVEEPF